MAVDQATVYLVMMAIVGIIMLLASIFCNDNKKGKRAERDGGRQPAARARDENLPQGVRRRGRRNRMANRGEESDDDDLPNAPDEFNPFEDFEGEEKKIGKKKMLKLQAKEERKQQRLAEEEERKERKEREALLEKQRKKEEEIAKAEEAARAEEERIRKEEEERREHEEYLKMKEAFSVEEEGEEDIGPDLSSQSLLQEFIDYIKEMKVIMLEDLAAHFKIKTQDAADRVKELQTEGRLTGVMDDRGKFIFITMEELESVAKFIKQHGRVSISDLAESSNRLINLNPDNAEVQKRLLSEVSA
ncbi:DDRGK domain-containing protein 1-like [Saccostrea echinata]|uniref:DDRGK domain-containing protein 1-like n=1 Tax=Saccostrea echinata TaxID=191078 RepID=UPI002A7F5D5E|nr:DDRGK domain-containing protein 1-like [Saccostrea echinata]